MCSFARPRFAHRRFRSDEDGFTMIEVLVAAVVLLGGVVVLLSLVDMANRTTANTRARDAGTTLARQVTEAARSIPYAMLTPQTVEAELQSQPGLASRESGEWTLERQNTIYTVAASVCAVDDPSDGTGPHDAGVYCDNSATGGTSDKNPDDYKRVTVDLTWTLKNREHNVHQVAVINHPGSAGGPSVKQLTILAPATPRILSAFPSVAFTATTSAPAATLTFSVDGAPTATATGPSLLWNFTWPIAELVDGTHLVTAQAFDRAGLSGATRAVTVTLNRFAPHAPSGLAGGRNGDVVELEWLPNPERDIAGYRAYRGLPGTATLVCGLTRKLSCQDDAPPDGPLTYFVVAVDVGADDEYRNGLPSTPVAVTTGNHAPNAPANLQASEANGEVTLSWDAPDPADEDGDAIAFYRIYRDGTTAGHRYDRTGSGIELSLVDGRTDGEPHEYWVTAVDGQLAESAPIGPVSP